MLVVVVGGGDRNDDDDDDDDGKTNDLPPVMNFPPVFQPRDEILAVEGRGRVEEGREGYCRSSCDGIPTHLP